VFGAPKWRMAFSSRFFYYYHYKNQSYFYSSEKGTLVYTYPFRYMDFFFELIFLVASDIYVSSNYLYKSQ
jgi:hypothetical protein